MAIRVSPLRAPNAKSYLKERFSIISICHSLGRADAAPKRRFSLSQLVKNPPLLYRRLQQ
jgi:hypothetical protein